MRFLGVTAALLLLAVTGPGSAATGGPLPQAPPERLAAGTLLVASEQIKDPRFWHTVILLVHAGPDGAMGVIINRPIKLPLSEALPDVEELQNSDQPLYFGGPVSTNFFTILFTSDDEIEMDGITRVFDNVYYSGSIETLKLIFKKKQGVFRGFSGYAGWGAGQLENEISRGDWSLKEADRSILFEKDPAAIWDDLDSGSQWRRWIFAPTETFGPAAG